MRVSLMGEPVYTRGCRNKRIMPRGCGVYILRGDIMRMCLKGEGECVTKEGQWGCEKDVQGQRTAEQ